METFDIGHTSYKIHERQMPTVSKIRMNCIWTFRLSSIYKR